MLVVGHFSAKSQDKHCHASFAATRLNILYIGVGNDVEIRGADAKSTVVCEGCDSINEWTKGMAKVWVSNTKGVKLAIKVADKTVFLQTFRVKYCPNPTVQLTNGQKNGKISAPIFRSQKGILSILKDFDYNIRCHVTSFKLTLYRNGVKTELENSGTTFTDSAKKMTESAKKGDLFVISEVKCRCQGDTKSRDLENLVFEID